MKGRCGRLISIPRASATVPVAGSATGAAPVIEPAPPSVTHVGTPTTAGAAPVQVLQAAKEAYAAATTLDAGGSSGSSGGGRTRRMEEEVWQANAANLELFGDTGLFKRGSGDKRGWECWCEQEHNGVFAQ